MEGAEGVEEVVLEEVVDSLAFFGGEASVFGVLLGAGEVDGLMGDIEVTAGNDGFLGMEKIEVGEEEGVPDLVAEGEAFEGGFAIRGVDIDEEEVGEFESLEATLGHGVTEGVDEAREEGVGGGLEGGGEIFPVIFGGEFCQDGGAGVAETSGGVPELVVIGGDLRGIWDFGRVLR